MNAKLFRRAAVAALSGVLLACGGDATAPDANLSQEQVDDMMDALSAAGSFSTTGMSIAQAAVVSSTETAPCPKGGTTTAQISMNVNADGSTGTGSVTQTFNACKAESSTGRLWTFNGSPNIKTNFSFTFNPTTEAGSFTATQTGGLNFESDVASGRCSINLSMSLTSTATGGTMNVSGTVCGRTVDLSVDDSGA